MFLRLANRLLTQQLALVLASSFSRFKVGLDALGVHYDEPVVKRDVFDFLVQTLSLLPHLSFLRQSCLLLNGRRRHGARTKA